MTPILKNYVINEATMALVPAARIDFDTIAIEINRELRIRKTPHQLLRSACLDNWSTYDGRREAVTHHFGFKRKVPIPINPGINLYTFPTHSPSDFACNWIFHSHVQALLPAFGSSQNTPAQTTIIFKNRRQMPLDVSHYVLAKQLERTGMCVGRFGNGNVEGIQY
ncbi:competence protein [Lentibacillus kapialis]|uniref:Competence protein n=1 Tax=Lentibacillus kapialis TaxID=340214 RepID=A0A917UZV0_9BACI|nr:competence protein ComK [Lentibacillus kapialis]GGK02407.1 competence protein [Lentibacillus kapialis]